MKVTMAALLGVCLACAASQASAQPIIAGQCPALGDLAAQIAGWRNRGKTEAQAIEQTRKYYQDETDRRALASIVDEIYSDTHAKLVPERVSLRITSECAVAMQGKPAN